LITVSNECLYPGVIEKSKYALRIRDIEAADSPSIKKIIHEVMPEYSCNTEGFALSDDEVEDMYSAYQENGTRYFVATLDGDVVGGVGIAPLKGGDAKTCELRKMYLLKSARGNGLGKALLYKSVRFAEEAGYERCYLETVEDMKAAQDLYGKFGFERITVRQGDTGHFSCNVLYQKDLTLKSDSE